MKNQLLKSDSFLLNLRHKGIQSFLPSSLFLQMVSVLMLLFFSLSLHAQDKIYVKGNEVITAKIIEVGTEEIRYKIYADTSDIIYALEKDAILKVVYENGRVEAFMDKFRDPALYADQRHRAIKFNFLAPLLGFSQFTYEQSLKPGQSFETALGIIGMGRPLGGESSKGAFVSAGYKFIKLPNYYSSGTRYTHIMQGSYLRPNLIIGCYSSGENGETGSIAFGGLMLETGRQMVVANRFLVDIYVGAGYAIDNSGGYHYAILGGGGSGFGVTGGLKIGMLFK